MSIEKNSQELAPQIPPDYQRGELSGEGELLSRDSDSVAHLGGISIEEEGRGAEGLPMLPAPRLPEQLAQTRNDTVTYQQSSVDQKGEWQEMPSVVSVTESEMLSQLDAFLAEGERAAEQADDQEAADRARKARQNLSFIGHEEFEAATAGIASYWQSYLNRDPQNTLVIFNPAQSRMYKSADFVADATLSHLPKDPFVTQRVHLVESDFSFLHAADPERTKIVLVDDWVSSGAMMRSDARQVARDLRRAKLDPFIDRIEANLIVTRQKHVGEKPLQFIDNEARGSRRSLPLGSYYVADPFEDTGMYVFGAHSSVDHNDAYLRHLGELRARQEGRSVELPAAALIQRPYGSTGQIEGS